MMWCVFAFFLTCEGTSHPRNLWRSCDSFHVLYLLWVFVMSLSSLFVVEYWHLFILYCICEACIKCLCKHTLSCAVFCFISSYLTLICWKICHRNMRKWEIFETEVVGMAWWIVKVRIKLGFFSTCWGHSCATGNLFLMLQLHLQLSNGGQWRITVLVEFCTWTCCQTFVLSPGPVLSVPAGKYLYTAEFVAFGMYEYLMHYSSESIWTHIVAAYLCIVWWFDPLSVNHYHTGKHSLAGLPSVQSLDVFSVQEQAPCLLQWIHFQV